MGWRVERMRSNRRGPHMALARRHPSPGPATRWRSTTDYSPSKRKIVVQIRNYNSASVGETLRCESTAGGRAWSPPRAIGVWGLPSHPPCLEGQAADDGLRLPASAARQPDAHQLERRAHLISTADPVRRRHQRSRLPVDCRVARRQAAEYLVREARGRVQGRAAPTDCSTNPSAAGGLLAAQLVVAAFGPCSAMVPQPP